jgi:hypothetical protein
LLVSRLGVIKCKRHGATYIKKKTLRAEHRLRVFEHRVLRRLFGLKGDGITGEWRKLHNEELYVDLYPSKNIIRVTKSRRMRWAGHVAGMGDRRGAYRILVEGDLRERDHLEDPVVDGRIIFKWIFRKWDLGVWTGSIWLRISTGGGLL